MTAHRARGRPRHPDVLTPGEWRVTKAARYDMTNRQIVERLGIGIEAVKFHLANVLLKLSLADRGELLGWAGMPAHSPLATEEKDAVAQASTGSDRPLHIPPGFTSLFPYIFADGARAYLEFLDAGLGGDIVDVHTSPDGIVRNAHVRFGDTTIMVSEAGGEHGASRGTFYLYVADADLAMQQALAAGAEQVIPVDFRPYGERQGGVRDPSGNVWWLSQRLAPGGY